MNENAPKQTILQIRQTTAGLMESSNQYLQSFDNNKYHKTVIYLKGTLSEEKAKAVNADNVVFLQLPSKSLRGLKIRAFFKLLSVIKEINPSIIFAHRYHAVYLAGLVTLIKKIPVRFAVFHGTNEINSSGRRLFVRFRLKNSFFFIGVSNVVRQDLLSSRARLSPSQVFATPNSLDIEAQSSQLILKEHARAKLGIPENRYVVGNIARLSPDKNQAYLLRSFAKALEQCPQLFLVIVGEGRLDQSLKDLAQQLQIDDSVLFTGHIYRAADYIPAFDLFVMTSNKEGFGRVLIEAMVAKRPIIATDIPAFTEVLDGSGTLVRPDDVEGLANEILNHSEFPKEKVEEIISGQSFVLYDHFCLEKFKQRFSGIYHTIVNKHPSDSIHEKQH